MNCRSFCALATLLLVARVGHAQIEFPFHVGSVTASAAATELIVVRSNMFTIDSADFKQLLSPVPSDLRDCDPGSIGKFSGGLAGMGQVPGTGIGTPYPAINYAGGIGLDAGIVLTTGNWDNNSPHQNAFGHGIQGPNDAEHLDRVDPAIAHWQVPFDHEGESSTPHWPGLNITSFDADLAYSYSGGSINTADASVLRINVHLGAPGYIITTFV